MNKLAFWSRCYSMIFNSNVNYQDWQLFLSGIKTFSRLSTDCLLCQIVCKSLQFLKFLIFNSTFDQTMHLQEYILEWNSQHLAMRAWHLSFLAPFYLCPVRNKVFVYHCPWSVVSLSRVVPGQWSLVVKQWSVMVTGGHWWSNSDHWSSWKRNGNIKS